MSLDCINDFTEIQENKRVILSQNSYAIPEQIVEGAIESLRSRTPKSAALAKEAEKFIPGGNQHMIGLKKPYPLTFPKASGSRIWDADDNEYIDYIMMAGPIILGHNYQPLLDGVIDAIRTEGIGIGLMSEWETKASQMICKHMKNVEKVRFLQSGSEADIAAVRIARAVTGREKIIRMGGAYHGWSNEFLYDMQIPFAGALECHGVPKEYYMHIVSVPPNDKEALENAFKEHEGNIAGYILEPAGPETGAILMDPEYLKYARELCTANNALLIFDEVVTCFRFAMGGASEFYGIDPDLTVLGKVLTHGFPSCGAIGGKSEYMDCIGSGDASAMNKPVLRGTMAANVISSAATYYTINYLEETDAIGKANSYAGKMCDGINAIFQAKKLPFFCYNTASFVHFETACPICVDLREPDGLMSALFRKNVVDSFALVLQDEGLITKYGNRAIVSMAHSDEDLKKTLAIFDKTVDYFKAT